MTRALQAPRVRQSRCDSRTLGESVGHDSTNERESARHPNTARYDPRVPTPTAIDLYAGAGGATRGLRDAGYKVLGAVENDCVAAKSYTANHADVKLWTQDIRTLKATEVLRTLNLKRGELSLLKACPPCQGFSSLAEGRADVDEERNDLVLHTIRFVRALQPKTVMLENVPGLGRDQRASTLMGALRGLGYATKQYAVNAADYGVPQRRKRLIIIAARGLRTHLPEDLKPKTNQKVQSTVGAAFKALAAEQAADDALDRHRNLSDKTKRRVEAVPVNGTRFDLPEDLRLDCHVKLGRSRSATGSYGRLRADEPAPTMTTRCTTPACGSFIHPTEHRGITLREAATLQTFPHDYEFHGYYDQIERQIGNAVPVRMAAALGQIVWELTSGGGPAPVAS